MCICVNIRVVKVKVIREGELIYNCVVADRMMRLRIQLQMRRHSQERSREVWKAVVGHLTPLLSQGLNWEEGDTQTHQTCV